MGKGTEHKQTNKHINRKPKMGSNGSTEQLH